MSGAARLLDLSDAPRERHEDLFGEPRDLLEEAPEVGAVDDEKPQVSLRLHGRRAGLAVEQAHLAEELVGRLARTGEDGALRHLHDCGDVGHGAELAQAAVFEERNALEVRDFLVTGDVERVEHLSDELHHASLRSARPTLAAGLGGHLKTPSGARALDARAWSAGQHPAVATAAAPGACAAAPGVSGPRRGRARTARARACRRAPAPSGSACPRPA